MRQRDKKSKVKKTQSGRTSRKDFEKAATLVNIDSIPNIIERGKLLARNAKESGEGMGLARFLGVPEIACLAAIDHGLNYLYVISKFYQAPQASLQKTLKRLVVGKLVEPYGSFHEHFEFVGGRTRLTYRLTGMGKDFLTVMRQHEDKVLTYFDPLLEKHVRDL